MDQSKSISIARSVMKCCSSHLLFFEGMYLRCNRGLLGIRALLDSVPFVLKVLRISLKLPTDYL